MVGTLIKIRGYTRTLFVGVIKDYSYSRSTDEFEVGVLWSDGDISTELFSSNDKVGSFAFLHNNRWIDIRQNFNKFKQLSEET